MLVSAAEEAARLGARSALHATVEAGPRNEPARAFFAGLGCRATGVPAALSKLEWPAYVRRLGDEK